MSKNRNETVDVSDVLKGLDDLKGMKESLSRTMAEAMAAAVRDEAKVRAPVLKSGNEGYDNQQRELLVQAIYEAYDDRYTILTHGLSFRYKVSWNAKKAPHGHLLEFGHLLPYVVTISGSGKWFTPLKNRKSKGKSVGYSWSDLGLPQHAPVAPSPFLGPAFDAKLSSLNSIAVTAGAIRFKELLP